MWIFLEIAKKIVICQIFEQISILVKIYENFLKKFRFWSKLAKISKNVDFSQIFEKFRFWS